MCKYICKNTYIINFKKRKRKKLSVYLYLFALPQDTISTL